MRTNAKELFARLRQKILNSLDTLNDRVIKDIGDYMVLNIKGLVRKRISPPTNSNFKALKDSTIKYRKYLAKNNTTSQFYSPKRSNLHITGQLINSITWVKAATASLMILFKGKHKPYKDNQGKNIGEAIENQVIANGLADKGFKVLGDKFSDYPPKIKITVAKKWKDELRRRLRDARRRK